MGLLSFAILLPLSISVLAFDLSGLVSKSSQPPKETAATELFGLSSLEIQQSSRQVKTCFFHKDCSPDEFCSKHSHEQPCEATNEGECSKIKEECTEVLKLKACGCDGRMYDSPCSFTPFTRLAVLQMGSCPAPQAKTSIFEASAPVFSTAPSITSPAVPVSLLAKAGLCIKSHCQFEVQQCYNDNYCTTVMSCVDSCTTDDCAQGCMISDNSIYAGQLYQCAMREHCFGNVVEYV